MSTSRAMGPTYDSLLGCELTGWTIRGVYIATLSTDEVHSKELGVFESETHPMDLYRGKGYYGQGPHVRRCLALLSPDCTEGYLLDVGGKKFSLVRVVDKALRDQAIAKLTPDELRILRRDGV